MGGEEALTEADESRCETKAILTQTIFWFELLLTYEELHFSFENQTQRCQFPFCGVGGVEEIHPISQDFTGHCASLHRGRIGGGYGMQLVY